MRKLLLFTRFKGGIVFTNWLPYIKLGKQDFSLNRNEIPTDSHKNDKKDFQKQKKVKQFFEYVCEMAGRVG